MNLAKWEGKRTAIFMVLFAAILIGSNLLVYNLSRAKPAVLEQGPSLDGEESLADDDLLGTELFVEVLEKITKGYLEPVDLEQLLEGAVEGMLGVLEDPQTCYFDPKQLENYMIGTTGTFSGVGIRLAEIVEKIWVLELFPGSPAEQAGLNPGDRILRVDGIPIPAGGLQQAADLLRGPPGTRVEILIERPGVKEPVEFTLDREDVKVETVFSKIAEPGVGYIQITGFEQSTGDSFIRQLDLLETTDGLESGLIIDLRNNAGGLLDEALKVAGQLVPEGEVTRLVDRQGKVKNIHYSYAAGKPYRIVVLINEESASASEIIAGALQDHRAALLVGERTYGKATVQTLEDLEAGGALKFTIAKYLTPSGRDLHGEGLEPDYYLELAEAYKHYREFYPDILQEGDYGKWVTLLQGILGELGLGPLAASGYFDRDTAEALADFQAGSGLEASGVLDNLSSLRLRQAMDQLFLQMDPQLELARDLLLDPDMPSRGGKQRR